MGSRYGKITGLPIGYRFVPNDEELIECYLMKKVSNGPLPPDVVKDIDAGKLYGKHPKNVVENMCGHEKAWYFFIHLDSIEDEKTIRMVGDGIGFWRCVLAEDLIYNSSGDVYAVKTHWTYFQGPLSKGSGVGSSKNTEGESLPQHVLRAVHLF
ncbi:unnamed protein product [Fraxinus pennsylvanica]|uniref:NAC domain-containing protein n=1 Tax=Fraxinus pennsylvanica TaxID=56036 RepID=A0AAD1YPI4_9LAMI|nr:unnamed protein product [Fraxinus pennsylvanica]